MSCDKLIYATGANSSPIVPDWPKSDFEKPVIHSLEIGTKLNYIEETVQRATVVGRSKSFIKLRVIGDPIAMVRIPIRGTRTLVVLADGTYPD